MQELDAHLGGRRPFGLGFWPLPEDDPGVEIPRESFRVVAPDGWLVRVYVNIETEEHFQSVVDTINDGIKLANQEADHAIDEAIARGAVLFR